jgi:osmoprotectant transport system substrate-binding protein
VTRRKHILSAVGAMAAIALVAACGTGNSSKSSSVTSSGGGKKGSVTIAAFNFGESQILANMYADVLNKAGFTATVKKLTNREVVEPALEQGRDIQVVPEYLSTLTEFINVKVHGPNATPLASPDVNKTLAALKQLTANRNITPLTPSPATDQNAFAVTQKFATDNHLTKLSDLTTYKGPLTLGGPPECPTRPFCKPGLEKTYGLKFANFVSLDAGGPLTKTAIKNGKVTLGLVFSSDGGIKALGLKVLEDDKHLQNADNIVPVVNNKVLKPELETPLNNLSAKLTTDTMVGLNKMVDVDQKDPAAVAKTWLQQNGLL